MNLLGSGTYTIIATEVDTLGGFPITCSTPTVVVTHAEDVNDFINMFKGVMTAALDSTSAGGKVLQ